MKPTAGNTPLHILSPALKFLVSCLLASAIAASWDVIVSGQPDRANPIQSSSYRLAWPTTAAISPTPVPPTAVVPTPTPTAQVSPTPAPPASGTAAAQVSPTSQAAGTSRLVYTVRRGDSLSKIAASYGVQLDDLFQANHLTRPSILQIGQQIIVPQPAPTAAPLPSPTPDPQKWIEVDISDQLLSAYQGETLVYRFPVSTGAGGGTLTGDFHILDKLADPYSDFGGFWMPDWMGIYYVGSDLENGIHSLPVLPDGKQLWGDMIGTPASYGCVVLKPADAHQLFAWAEVGTAVRIRP